MGRLFCFFDLLPCYTIVMREKLFYLNSKGEKLCAVLSDPSGDFGRPIIVLCHGFNSSKEARSIVTLEKTLNAKNISTFRIDFFGQGESDGNFEDITASEAVDDVVRAVNFLKSKGYKRVGLVGSSFGGLACLIAAAKSHEIYVLALRSPVADYEEVEFLQRGEDGMLKWKHEKIASKENRPVKYAFIEDAKRNNGLAFAPKIFVPTLIVHGDADRIVPIGQSKKLASLIPGCRLEIIPGADHRYTDPEHFNKMIGLITEFIAGTSLN